MMRRRLVLVGEIAFLGLVVQGCGDEKSDPSLAGCQALMDYCINDSHFDDLRGLGVVDVGTAETAFRCMLDFYAGDCDARVTNILGCLSEVTAPAECSPCDSAFGELVHACPPPTPCMM